MFPIIQNIHDVLPHIDGLEEVRVFEKDSYTVIDYVMASTELFRPLSETDDIDELLKRKIRRECRGLIFDTATGNIIRRPYHKFFNVGENVDSLPDFIPFMDPHHIMFKLDGSMIAPFITTDGVLRWGTRAGETDVSAQIDQFLGQNPQYIDFARRMCGIDYTPIFEWMSRDNRVVIDHPEPKLVLTGVRDLETGLYIPYNDLITFKNHHGIEVCDTFDSEFDEIQKLITHTANEVDNEGYVIRFNDGTMYKLKTSWYVAIHKMKDQLLWERNVAELVLDGKIDDIKPFLMDIDVQRLEQYQEELQEFIFQKNDLANLAYDLVVNQKISRKEFALNYKDQFGSFASIIFNNFEDMQKLSSVEWKYKWYDGVESVIRNHTSSNTKFAEFKNKEGFNYEW